MDKTLTAGAVKEYELLAPVIDTGDTWFSIAFSRAGQIGLEEDFDGGDSSPKGSPKTADLILDLIQKNSKIWRIK